MFNSLHVRSFATLFRSFKCMKVWYRYLMCHRYHPAVSEFLRRTKSNFSHCAVVDYTISIIFSVHGWSGATVMMAKLVRRSV